jgi:hypothetical protein
MTSGERGDIFTFLSDLDAPELVHPVVYSPSTHRNGVKDGDKRRISAITTHCAT